MSGRIFYLESFLIKPERHFIELSVAIDNLLKKQQNKSFVFVGNKQLNQGVEDLLPGIVRGISQTVFEDLENGGKSLFQDLIDLDVRYKFDEKDLLIIPTAYENQILGVTKYYEQKKNHIPQIAIQFHVIFPPAKDSNDVMKKEFQEYWFKRMTEAFKKLPKTVTIWTTESENLNIDYSRVAGRKLGLLPVPFLIMQQERDEAVSKGKTNIGFLGEGRQEKGLIIFLKAIKAMNQKKNNFHFVIQNNNPRGFSDKEMEELLALLSEVKKYDNVEIIEGGIAPIDYHKLLLSLDSVVMPHNPANYCRRVSGLLIQGSIYNIPCIVSSGTEEQNSIEKGDTKGIIFEYDVNSQENTVDNLVATLYQFADKKDELRKIVLPSIEKLRKHNSALSYFKELLSQYPDLVQLNEIVSKGE